jgi:surfeit locus 1 family protein
MLLKVFSRRWLLTTLLVIVAVGVMVRLGIWQLDRLAQRRAFNARVNAQVDQPPLNLNQGGEAADLVNMEYRKVIVTGEYDFSQQVALRNQAHDSRWGVDLLTPLKVDGSDRAVLVNRGWIPADDFNTGDWSKYDEPGTVEVHGVLRRSQSKPDFGRKSDPIPAPGQRLEAWNFTNVDGIDRQTHYDLMPVYIQEAPDPSWTGLPYRTKPELDLSEGPHMGYAIQWFAFAAILAFGYPFFIRREETQKREKLINYE